jgi:hypothetical protein
MSDTRTVWEKLADPFPQSEVEFKPSKVSGNRTLALCYLTARAVEDRLDDVVGPANWRDEYRDIEGGSVECRLFIRADGEWLCKVDVGSPSEQPDAGDRTKAAYSDALKRAAVKWGIGRYLYFLEQSWCDYDPTKKRIVEEPRLPAWALPGGSGRPHKRPSPAVAVPHAVATVPKVTTAADLPAKADGGPKSDPKMKPAVKDNPALVARITQDLAQTKSRAGYDEILAKIVAAANDGLLSEADRATLRPLVTQTSARFPVVNGQPAGAK